MILAPELIIVNHINSPLSQVLFGKIRLRSYTPCGDYSTENKELITCERTADIQYDKNSAPITLTPYQNNIHEVYAMSDAAFFDFLCPPYRPKTPNRSCHFYKLVCTLDEQRQLFEMMCVGTDPEIPYCTDERNYSGDSFTVPIN